MEQQLHENHKGQFGSSFGFLMAAVGSAVGLGNLWGFPYKMGANGGFAFLVLYLILVVFVGYVIMISELALGRKTGKGVVGAYEALSKKYAFIGWMGAIAPWLILSFYSMLGGYCIKYALANLGDLFGAGWGVGDADSAAYFSEFTSDMMQTVIYSLIFVILTVLVVRGGVSGGIEKFTSIAMPALFVMLVIVIIRSVTLPGASEGLAFMFKPDWSAFEGTGWITVLAVAGGQMFFSLSLGMSIMIAYGSYLPKNESLERNALVIPLADTIVAIMAGLAIMPAVFASGLEPTQGPGLLFITLQTVFSKMGGLGPIFGFLFYSLVFIAAITSSISLLEGITAVAMDKAIEKGKKPDRKKLSTILGISIAITATLVSMDGLGANGFPQFFGQSTWLDAIDLISEGILMPLGACYCAIIIPTQLVDEEVSLNNAKFHTKGFYDFCIKFVAPVMMVLVLLGQLDTFFGLGMFG
ncbi:MAG: sodium-dependent transporter [Clostridiales bacterium]|nr:sodium-dependent transporter [Bacillota bacterium]MEE0517217.1 sodium-dependent transporter [Anaerovoracaceae bacterium]PWL94030.1 MAG: sodium-dependent transporter [Clostridiales bacterium]